MNIRALTFDLNDTVWDNRPVLMAAEQSLYDWLGTYWYHWWNYQVETGLEYMDYRRKSGEIQLG